jgi:hypothetical protein
VVFHGFYDYTNLKFEISSIITIKVTHKWIIHINFQIINKHTPILHPLGTVTDHHLRPVYNHHSDPPPATC